MKEMKILISMLLGTSMIHLYGTERKR